MMTFRQLGLWNCIAARCVSGLTLQAGTVGHTDAVWVEFDIGRGERCKKAITLGDFRAVPGSMAGKVLRVTDVSASLLWEVAARKFNITSADEERMHFMPVVVKDPSHYDDILLLNQITSGPDAGITPAMTMKMAMNHWLGANGADASMQEQAGFFKAHPLKLRLRDFPMPIYVSAEGQDPRVIPMWESECVALKQQLRLGHKATFADLRSAVKQRLDSMPGSLTKGRDIDELKLALREGESSVDKQKVGDGEYLMQSKFHKGDDVTNGLKGFVYLARNKQERDALLGQCESRPAHDSASGKSSDTDSMFVDSSLYQSGDE